MSRISSDRDAFLKLGKSLNQKHANELSTQLSVFQSVVVNFAVEHGDSIRTNPEFRAKFTQICLLIGIDSLELLLLLELRLKKKDNFYCGLAIRIVETCQQTRDINGGLISMRELRSRMEDSTSVPLVILDDDILKALSILNGLGEGFELLTINKKRWIRHFTSSGKKGISSYQQSIYELCEFMGGYVTYRLLRDNYGWDKVRLKTVIDEMIMNGFLWIDSQGSGDLQFWEPSWISK